jgi:SAM-dependent MidA family methyltransferase
MPNANCRKRQLHDWIAIASRHFGHWAFGIDGVVTLQDLIVDRVRRDGPITTAAYIDLALYHPELGYYARAGQRSGRGGDFFTSVDVGPLFGELLAGQIAECTELLASFLPARGAPPALAHARPSAKLRATLSVSKGRRRGSAALPSGGPPQRASVRVGDPGASRGPQALPRPPASVIDVVEAGAGNGRLARDVMDALARDHPGAYERVRLHLVERSDAARAAHAGTLGPHVARLASSGGCLPPAVTGVIFANELLDALPVHAVVMRRDGLKEIYIGERAGRLVEVEGPRSTPAIEEHLRRVGARLAPGQRAEVNLAAQEWIEAAARALTRGFLLLIDYGHEAAELYSATHAAGTLTTFRRHRAGPDADWLAGPGEQDITAHVDLTAVRVAAERAGLTTMGVLDQTYFLLGLGIADRVGSGFSRTRVGSGFSRTLQAKTLMLPGGLGSTHKVMIFGKGVGAPALKGLSYKVRIT